MPATFRRRRQTQPFLLGPVPMPWLYRAGRLRGHALHIGILLWHEAGMRRNRTVKLSITKAREFGIHRDTAIRAVRDLERAGLVSIRYNPGECLEVTILDEATPVNNFPHPHATETAEVGDAANPTVGRRAQEPTNQ